MTRLAGMQPYFFPYLGYWQLIDAVDLFVLFDVAQFMRQGWVNRNRILKPGGGWQYIQVPVSRHPVAAAIRDVKLAPVPGWKARIFGQLAHYKSKAPCYGETIELVEAALLGGQEQSIGELNCRIVRVVCEALSIRSKLVVASEHDFDYSAVQERGDWGLVYARSLGATEIVNPVHGAPLLNTPKLAASGIGLQALHPPSIEYSQAGMPFEPALSIVDVMMFNGIAETARLLSMRSLTAVEQPAAAAPIGAAPGHR